MYIYRIAEMNIAVKARYEETYRYMADFLTDSGEYELLIEPTDEMIRYEAELGEEIHGDPGSPYICEAVAILRVICDYIIVIVVFQISQIIFGGCLRGAGDVKFTLFASLISVTIIRTLVTWGLTSVFNLGLAGIWIGILSDQISRFIFLSLRFRKGEWTQLMI